MIFRCVDVFTAADGRREYRLSVIVEQTAPVIFRVGKRYDFIEAGPESGANSQLETSLGDFVKKLSPKQGDLVCVTLQDGIGPDDLPERLSLLAEEGKYNIIIGALNVDVLSDEQLAGLGLKRVIAKAGKAQ